MTEYSSTSGKKRRGRPPGPTRKTLDLRAQVRQILEDTVPPLTLRQIYYIAVSRQVIAKTKSQYERLVKQVGLMREEGTLPWRYIADHTRYMRRPEMWGSVEEALQETVSLYRRDYWRSQPYRVELWCESDSVASFLDDVMEDYGVPLFACRGQASKTFVHSAATQARAIGKPVQIIYVGDWDPSGLAIDRAVGERMSRYIGGAVDVNLHRVAVTPEMVPNMLHMSSPFKDSDSNQRKFQEECARFGVPAVAIEAEAIPPEELRSIVRQNVCSFIDWPSWETMERYEQAERDQLQGLMVSGLGGVE